MENGYGSCMKKTGPLKNKNCKLEDVTDPDRMKNVELGINNEFGGVIRNIFWHNASKTQVSLNIELFYVNISKKQDFEWKRKENQLANDNFNALEVDNETLKELHECQWLNLAINISAFKQLINFGFEKRKMVSKNKKKKESNNGDKSEFWNDYFCFGSLLYFRNVLFGSFFSCTNKAKRSRFGMQLDIGKVLNYNISNGLVIVVPFLSMLNDGCR